MRNAVKGNAYALTVLLFCALFTPKLAKACLIDKVCRSSRLSFDPSFSLLSLLTNAKNVKKERKKIYNICKTRDKEIACDSARSYLAPLYARAPLRGCQIDLDRITEVSLQMSIKGFSTRYIFNFQLEFLELSTIINDWNIIRRFLRATSVSDTLYMFNYSG